jgi:hypothetical protein
MILKLKDSPIIENTRHYSAETVANLRSLLTEGAWAVPDPHRRNFYDVENGEHIYYIHICPSGRVLLLATWLKEHTETPAPEHELAAVSCA